MAIVGVLWVLVQNSHQNAVPLISALDGGSESDTSPVEISADPSLGSDADHSRRLLYPYSVIKGGVRDVRELQEAISRDPVVARHFADFKLERTRIVRLPAAKLTHVAYRVHSDVFWTRRKLKLVAGERVITDGKNYARARCGNRITDEVPKETSLVEPSSETLDRPQADPPVTTSSPTPETLALLPPPPVPGSTPVVNSPPDDGGFVPPIPIIPLGGGSSPPDNPVIPPPPGEPPNPPPPVTPVPEPGSLLLVSSGLAGYLAYRKKLKK